MADEDFKKVLETVWADPCGITAGVINANHITAGVIVSNGITCYRFPHGPLNLYDIHPDPLNCPWYTWDHENVPELMDPRIEELRKLDSYLKTTQKQPSRETLLNRILNKVRLF